MTTTTEALTTSSSPVTRSSSPKHHSLPRFSTPPPPPPSSAVPTDFRSSLAAWWSNTSYKEARIAEERLLRRMAHYQPPPATQQDRGWFGWTSGQNGSASSKSCRKDSELSSPKGSPAALTETLTRQDSVVEPLQTEHGLVASLRNVFIPTPDPSTAPAHPADPIVVGNSPSGSTASVDSQSTSQGSKGPFRRYLKDKGKMVDYINTLEISRPGYDGKEAVVVLHGYAAALGFFFRNWEPISTHAAEAGRRTFFLDWLGMGLSSRPSPSLLSGASSSSSDPAIAIPQRVSRAEHFFLSSLESWRQAVGIEKMVLVGHSLGGYLASAYAVRYPHRVSSLILVSPAGIPHGPEYTKFPTSAERLASSKTGDGKIGMNAGDKAGTAPGMQRRLSSPTNELGLDAAADAAEQEMGQGGGDYEPKGEAKQWREGREQSMFRRNAMKFFVWGWERGISPFTFLRSMGPLGPMFAGRYSLRRFGAQSEEDVRDLHGYIYNTSVLKGSGEFCISHILAPGAYARIPIVDRINQLKVPVTFIYGDNDWMDVDGGHASQKALEQAGNDRAKVHVVPKAGHHVYLDNPEETNRIIGEAIKAVPL